MSIDIDACAARVLAAADARTPIAPLSASVPSFGLAEAYGVSERVTALRIARGERPVGWKIGFTNTTIWDEYGVHAPIWGPMFDSTVAEVPPGDDSAECSLAGLLEPRIEPEIVFRLSGQPRPDMDERDLLDNIDGVTHGFEIVQSLFPEWRFQAADTVAAFALHGRLRHGPFLELLSTSRSEWIDRLRDFRIVLSRDGVEVDSGVAANVLGGPLSALRHLVSGMAHYPSALQLRPGDLITTGTITRAFPIRAGETWSTALHGLPLRGMKLRFRD
jgi:2-keto-4-pentenoate hydratase